MKLPEAVFYAKIKREDGFCQEGVLVPPNCFHHPENSPVFLPNSVLSDG